MESKSIREMTKILFAGCQGITSKFDEVGDETVGVTHLAKVFRGELTYSKLIVFCSV